MFTYKIYENILSELLTLGYSYEFFTIDKPKEYQQIFLRHDIDLDIAGCKALSNIEKNHGVNSTFFFQPNNSFYNPIEDKNVSIFSLIIENGSRIGLHIDGNRIASINELEEYLNLTYDYYSKFIPISKIFSFHRPSPKLLNNIHIKNFTNAYEERFFNEIKYFSDSNQRNFYLFGFSDFILTKRSFQLLIHPIWWSEYETSIWDVNNNFLEKIKNKTKNSMKENVEKFNMLYKYLSE